MSLSWRTLKFVTPKRLASVVAGAGGLVCAQTAYLQSTYVPLPRPSGGATHGVELWQESNADQHSSFSEEQSLVERLRSTREASTRRRNVLIIGDSLVVGIGCKEAPVMPQIICKRLANLLKVCVRMSMATPALTALNLGGCFVEGSWSEWWGCKNDSQECSRDSEEVQERARRRTAEHCTDFWCSCKHGRSAG